MEGEGDLPGSELTVMDSYPTPAARILLSFGDLGIAEILRVSSFGRIDLDAGSGEEGWREKREIPFVSKDAMADVSENG